MNKLVSFLMHAIVAVVFYLVFGFEITTILLLVLISVYQKD
jgi:hypothetical protein